MEVYDPRELFEGELERERFEIESGEDELPIINLYDQYDNIVYSLKAIKINLFYFMFSEEKNSEQEITVQTNIKSLKKLQPPTTTARSTIDF